MKLRKIYLFAPIVILLAFGLNALLIHFESANPESSITNMWLAWWYMLVTLTTVGYGDLYPITPAGKLIGYIYVFSSLGVLGFLFSAISNKIYAILEEKRLGYQGTDFTNHILFVGWNDFSKLVADEVYHSQKKLAIVTDRKEDIDLIYARYDKKQVFVLFNELSNFEMLEKVNANAAKTLFVSFKEDSESLLYIIKFKKLYPKPDIVASLQNLQLKETFEAAGVTYVVTKNEIASKLVASYIFEPDVADMNLDLLSSAREEGDFDMQQYRLLEDHAYVGKDSEELFFDLKEKHNAVLLAISKTTDGKRKLIKNPPKGTTVAANDYLILMCSGHNKAELRRFFNTEEGRTV